MIFGVGMGGGGCEVLAKSHFVLSDACSQCLCKDTLCSQGSLCWITEWSPLWTPGIQLRMEPAVPIIYGPSSIPGLSQCVGSLGILASPITVLEIPGLWMVSVNEAASVSWALLSGCCPGVILNFTSHVPPSFSEFRNPPGGLGFPGLLWCKKKPLFSGLSPNSCLFLRTHLPTKAGDCLRLTNHCPLLPLAFNSSVSPDRFLASYRDSSSLVSFLGWRVHSVSVRQHVGVDTKQTETPSD